MRIYTISLSLMLLFCFGIYRANANIGVEAGVLNIVDGCACDRIYEPVCASDTKTYPNHCLYECARKKLAEKGRSLELLRAGVCVGAKLGESKSLVDTEIEAEAVGAEEDNAIEQCSCNRSLVPVCGSDNRTYSNLCIFNCKRKILARLGTVLRVLRQGACK